MENKSVFFSILLALMVLLTSQKSVCQFRPDSTINNKLYLLDGLSIENELGDLMAQLNEDADLPDTYLLSTDGKQYLRLVFFPGSSNNEFATYEVGYSTIKLKNKRKISFKSFQTEKGIRLGLSKSKFLSIMKNHVKKKGNTYLLRITKSNDPFLKKYDMPIYEAKYFFKNNVLVKFYFGFEYP
jgi:hypothetical protein